MQKIGAPIRLRIVAAFDVAIKPLADCSPANILSISNIRVLHPGPLFEVIDAPVARSIGPEITP